MPSIYLLLCLCIYYLRTTLRRRLYYFHFKEENTNAKSASVICERFNSQYVKELGSYLEMSCKVDPGTSQLFGPQWKLGSFTVIMCHLCYPTSNYPGNTLNFPVGTVYLMINASAVGGDLPHDLGLSPYAHPIPQDTVQTRSMRYAGENTLPFPPWTGNKETGPLCLLFKFIIVYIGFYSQL